MAATRYDLLKLWDDLEQLFNTFNSDNTTPASSKEDDEAFELAHKAIREMIADGRASQVMAMWYPLAKAELGLKAKNALLNNFGPDQTPPIKGIKSLAFLRDVILPHVDNAQKVEYDYIFTYLCSFVGIDVEAERVQAGELAQHYRRIIASMELADEAPKEVVGEQFRLFRSSSKEVLPASIIESAAAAAELDVSTPRLGD